VAAGELIRFGREEFQRGWNRCDEPVVALAMGAPLEYGNQPKLRYCERCGERPPNTLGSADGGAARVAHCDECGADTGRWVRESMPGTVP
jgi:hypothetical protein